jgi:hypothetical protein
VAGQRIGLVLDVHQAWRIYPDLVNLGDVSDLVGMLRRFSDVFGTEIELGGKKGNFILAANIPKDQEIATKAKIRLTIDKSGKKSTHRTIAITCFVQNSPAGNENQAALANSIDIDRYAEVLKSRGW